MNMSDFASPYEPHHRPVTNPSTSRSFQPTTSHVEMHGLPIFSTHAMTSSVPYQSGAFAFDSLATNPYNLQQAFPVTYPTTMTHNVSYPGVSDIQPLPTVRTARNGFANIRTPMVKAESTSPVQSHHAISEGSYAEGYNRSTSEPSEINNINFATDVDTLMRAIQAKQSNPSSKEPTEVCLYCTEPRILVPNKMSEGAQTWSTGVQTLRVHHFGLWQSLLPEDPPRHSPPSAHW